jgi:hypothetical protein
MFSVDWTLISVCPSPLSDGPCLHSVNATTLLIALGLPMDQHEKHIYPDDKPRHQTIIGTDHSPGVSGVWVSLAQAQGIAQSLTGVNVAENGDSPIGNILRDDLFHLFATMASLNPKHAPGVQFGLSTVSPLHPTSFASGRC